MMAGSTTFQYIQLGAESAKGTPVAATTIFRGMGVPNDQREILRPQERVGIAGGTTRKYEARKWGEVAIPSVEATFEQLPYFFESGVNIETPTQDGAGTGYIYNYLQAISALPAIRTYTLEGGDNQQGEELDYVFCKHLNLAGSGQGALMMTADLFGREVSDAAKTPALAIPPVEEIIVNSGRLFIDEPAGTVGTTEVANTLFEIDFDIVTGQQEFWAMDGSNDFSFNKYSGDIEALVLKLTYEHNASAVAEKAKYRSKTDRLIRLMFEGSALGTPGVWNNKTLQIDLAGFYNQWDPLDENQGNDIVKAEFIVAYNTVAALKADFTIVNELTVLP